MALLHLRRTISSRNSFLFLLRSSTSFTKARTFSNTTTLFSPHLLSNSVSHKLPSATLPSFDFLKQSRRGFAKGKNKSKDDSAGGTVESVDIGPTVKATANSQMDAAVVALSRELQKLRTGRASAGMLDHIIVETDGVKLPLNRSAVVSVMDAKTLSVNPYDPNTLKQLENAIVSSPLGLNPQRDGDRLIAVIPPLTKEHTQAMCKVVAKSCEDCRQSIRRARQKAMDTVKKAGSSFAKDDAKKLEKEIEEMTKKFVKSAEDMCNQKEKEIKTG
ncbi:ribosome-recycling factor [Populus alba x Populus x berolinensis]|nr:ribosome-recycling factor [Populus alba x Populus x berolinensis]